MSCSITIAHYTTGHTNTWKCAHCCYSQSTADLNKDKDEKTTRRSFCVIHIIRNYVMDNHNCVHYININISSPAKLLLSMKSEHSELRLGVNMRIS